MPETEVQGAATAEVEAAPKKGKKSKKSAEDAGMQSTWPRDKIVACCEALLFASPDVLTFNTIRRIIPEDEVINQDIRDALEAIRERYEADGFGIMLTEVGGGYRIQSREEYFEWVKDLAHKKSEEKITQAALETLAIIAYKQPISRAEIDAIRGVGCGQLIRTLMDKRLVRVTGRVDVPGRPFLYGTSKRFLEQFGLANLKDLPRDAEI